MHCLNNNLRRVERGFTLTELLLSVVILLMLVGAAVFSFSSLQRDAQLDEGIVRIETLIRLARAHAANSGRQVQVVFTPQEEAASTGNVVQVVWEPEPLAKPGEFVVLPQASSAADSVNELVLIETPKPLEPEGSQSSNPTEVMPANEALILEPTTPTAISFYPDGSSDAAEIIVTSRNGEDLRRVSLQLMGTTGSMHVQWLSGE